MKLLEKFGKRECKSLPKLTEMNFKKLCRQVGEPDLVNPSKYRQWIGDLIFLVNTSLDICYSVNMLIQFMTKPIHTHWIACKHNLRYFHGTITLVLRYFLIYVLLHGYTDVAQEGNFFDKNSMSIARSIIQVEYIAISMARWKVVWLRNIFGELFTKVLDTTMIY